MRYPGSGVGARALSETGFRMTIIIRRILMIMAAAVLLPCLADAALITIRGTSVSPVPEPGTMALLGVGLLICGRLLRRKKEEGEESVA